MARIHFLKEGGDENYAVEKGTFSISEVTNKLSEFEVQFHMTGPRINPDAPVNRGSKHKFVVLEVEAGEENQKFQKAGYYIILGLTPRRCADMLGIYY